MLSEIPTENAEGTGKNACFYAIISNLKFIFLSKLRDWTLEAENKNKRYLETLGFVTLKTV